MKSTKNLKLYVTASEDLNWKVALINNSIREVKEDFVVELIDYPYNYIFTVKISEDVPKDTIVLSSSLCDYLGIICQNLYTFIVHEKTPPYAKVVNVRLFKNIDLDTLADYLKAELISFPFKIFDIFYFKEIDALMQILSVKPHNERIFTVGEDTDIIFSKASSKQGKRNTFYLSTIETLTYLNKQLRKEIRNSKNDVLGLLSYVFSLGYYFGKERITDSEILSAIENYSDKTEFIDRYLLVNLEDKISQILRELKEERNIE